MSILKQAAINEMARAIANSNTCYIHRYTSKITTFINATEDPKLMSAQEKTLLEIEKKRDDYVKVEKPNAENELMIMRRFLEEVPDRSTRKELSNALNRKKPARNFMMAVESDMEMSQHWRNFHFKEYQQWVSNVIIDAYNY